MMAHNDTLAAKALPWHWDQRRDTLVGGNVRSLPSQLEEISVAFAHSLCLRSFEKPENADRAHSAGNCGEKWAKQKANPPPANNCSLGLKQYLLIVVGQLGVNHFLFGPRMGSPFSGPGHKNSQRNQMTTVKVLSSFLRFTNKWHSLS